MCELPRCCLSKRLLKAMLRGPQLESRRSIKAREQAHPLSTMYKRMTFIQQAAKRAPSVCLNTRDQVDYSRSEFKSIYFEPAGGPHGQSSSVYITGTRQARTGQDLRVRRGSQNAKHVFESDENTWSGCASSTLSGLRSRCATPSAWRNASASAS